MKTKLSVNMHWNGQEVKIKGKNVSKLGPFRAGKIIHAQAVVLCPVQDGYLRDSLMVVSKDDSVVLRPDADMIQAPTEDNTVYVGTAVHYAPYQEFGTIHMSAQPFLRPAFDLAQGKALTVVEEEGRNQFKEYFK